MNTDKIISILDDFANNLKKDLTASLKRYGHVSATNSGTQSGIIGSMDFNVYERGKAVRMEFYMDDYWYWLEYGRGKTKVGKSDKPFEKTLAGRIYRWIPQKGIDARKIILENYKNKLKGDPSKSKFLKKPPKYNELRKSLSYAIANNIHKKGWTKYPKGSKFMSKVMLDGRFDVLAEQISEVLGKEIVFNIKEVFEKQLK